MTNTSEVIIATDLVYKDYFMKQDINYYDAGNWRKDSPVDDQHITNANKKTLQDEITRNEIFKHKELETSYKFFKDILFHHYPYLKDLYFQILDNLKETNGEFIAKTTAVKTVTELCNVLPKADTLKAVLYSWKKNCSNLDIHEIESFRSDNSYHASWLAKLDRKKLEDNVAMIRLTQLRSIQNLFGLKYFVDKMRSSNNPEVLEVFEKNSQSIEPMRTKNVIRNLNVISQSLKNK